MSTPKLPHVGVVTRLGASAIDGVGVIAVEFIAAGTLLFAHDVAEIRWIDADAIDSADLTDAQRAFYRDFAIRRDGKLGCPASFDLLTAGWYLNQPLDGARPNIHPDADYRLFAARDIQAGEELTLDYEALNRGSRWT